MENKDIPAFPATIKEYSSGDRETVNVGYSGLSKRELIAAMAMHGLLSNHELTTETTPLEVTARDAVKQADALITELSKPQT